ncbi:hypothetical protein [Streptomyces sp. NPDC057617]|uniref:hypothetical protein n=1 Tax=Streptomyces sp. NPDC057617 TaxID=3346184 RepID=UPI0036BD9F8A
MSHRRTPSAAFAALVLALAFAALTGCSRNAPGPGSGDAGGPTAQAVLGDLDIPEITIRVEKPVPIEGYLLSDEQWRRLGAAEEVLRQRCMRRFGLSYEIFQPRQQDGPAQTLSEFRYGVLDPGYAAEYGYRTPAAREQASAEKQSGAGVGAQDTVPLMSKDEKLVLLGGTDPAKIARGEAQGGGQDFKGQKVPKGGCVGEARERLGGGDPAGAGDSQLANDINLNSFSRSLEDKRVQDVFAKWSACMKKKGYAYPTPIEASNDKRWAASPGSAEERAVATLDAKCKMENNVTGVWYAVDVAYQDQGIDQNAGELDAVEKGIDERMKLAADVMRRAE